MYNLQKRVVVDYRKYPFLADPIDLAKRRYGVSDLSLLARLRKDLLEASEERLKRALSKGTLKGFTLATVEEEVLSFALCSCTVALLEGKWALARYALAEAERAHEYLEKEEAEVLAGVARALGVDVEYLGGEAYREPLGFVGSAIMYSVYEYAMPFPSYVKHAQRLLADPSWSPVNLPVLRGYVYLQKSQLARLLKEAVFAYVQRKSLEILERSNADALREVLAPLLDEARKVLERLWRKRGGSQERGTVFTPGVLVEEALPPCIREIYQRARLGEHLSHHERFALATFMLNLGMDVEEVIDVFRKLPDFNERVARYQVEHLAGLRGSMKKYRTYSCEKMKLLGLCRGECDARSPLTAYYRNLKKFKLSKPGVGGGEKNGQGVEKAED